MITREILIEKRKEMRARIEAFTEKINAEEYRPLVEQFVKDNVPYEKGKVYELVNNGTKRRGYKRFVIYCFEISYFNNRPMVQCGLWWLDENSTPSKWDDMIVFGVSNAAEFKLSENQTNHKVPKHLAK